MFKLTLKKIFLLVYLALAVFLGWVFYASYDFLYKNFYLAMAQSEEIITLKKNALINTINIENFRPIMENIEKKRSENNLGDIKSPFN
jgi:hypothetical protein